MDGSSKSMKKSSSCQSRGNSDPWRLGLGAGEPLLEQRFEIPIAGDSGRDGFILGIEFFHLLLEALVLVSVRLQARRLLGEGVGPIGEFDQDTAVVERVARRTRDARRGRGRGD